MPEVSSYVRHLNVEDVMTTDVIDVPFDEDVEENLVVNDYVVVEDNNDDETDLETEDEEDTEFENDIHVEFDGFDN